jgi:glutamate dehydrogenase
VREPLDEKGKTSMLHQGEELRQELIEKTLQEAHQRLGDGKSSEIKSFIAQYFKDIPVDDMLTIGTDALFGAAVAHWKQGWNRKSGKTKLRVYNPTLEEHGWASDHTIVEIITADMPFLVDSITSELARRELDIHYLIHPIIKVRRGDDGALLEICTVRSDDDDAVAESYIHMEISEQSGKMLEKISGGIKRVLDDIQVAVEDWPKMRQTMGDIIDNLERPAKGTSKEDFVEIRDFLKWARDDNFTFLGYREYTFKDSGKKTIVSVSSASELGILRNPDAIVLKELQDLAAMPPAVHAFISQPNLLMIAKTDQRSTIHRPVHLDSIAIKSFDKKGRVVGQRVFVGLFTFSAYNRSPREIPLLRKKVEKVFARADFSKGSHNAKALANILETFPRDELFQVSDEHLFQTSLGILHLQERQRVALFIRRDEFERYIACLLYVPRDHYTTDMRHRMQKALEEAFNGETSVYYTMLGDLPLVRVYLVIKTAARKIPAYDAREIEAELAEMARSWTDRLEEALVSAKGEEQGVELFHNYRNAFPSSYRDHIKAPEAIADITKLEEARDSGEMRMSLYRPIEAADNQLWFKIYSPDSAIPLSDVLPVLEHMGLKVMDEIPHTVRPQGNGSNLMMIHDFGLQTRNGQAVDLGAVRQNFQETFNRIWRGEVESDGFNVLVLHAELAWREVSVLRAYCKYLRQAQIAFSQSYMEATLANNPHLARKIVRLFLTRFDPDGGAQAKARAKALLEELNQDLDKVASADEDRILRRFINLVSSTLRTNYFQKEKNGEIKAYISFKLDSQKVEELPLPRPAVEVFVYSPRVEAIHLRGGKVARGGIRWSDRREDFRTEILGLMKAQMVKNAVIVPIGAKGGFVVKRPPETGGREAFIEEGIECYKILMRGLLDISDNLSRAKVIAPPDTVRLDEDDPYLVVAADKGTATFSDIANGISEDYGFWLGDAFASGGSVGYDHKKMGITARGAWESVKRHFREMGVNTQEEDFSVVGVGDMSGDVFGNGMLLSRHIKLVAAFNHMHIFIDPDPDPEKSFDERSRLFNLPRSGWSDYDPKLISKGGAVFARSAKKITLSPEIKSCFAIIKDELTPNQLIKHLLGAGVDLLWFGGIGTYVKADDEADAEAGDRTNDALRVNASALRCSVIGEGANMGVTQRARIEYALGGGRCNTDAIDNSAGVDCSDHEVNIKVLVDQVVDNGDMTTKQRNALLAKMTDEVGQLVLRDNYYQTQAISLIRQEGADAFDHQVRLIRMLEKAGRLNRAVEFLPDDETLLERAASKQALATPEIAVLMSYSKIWVYDELLQSDLPEDKYLINDLARYFPTPLRKKYKKVIANHRLRREIIATRITNSMINRVGGTFVNRLMERTGMMPPDIARTYVISCNVLQAFDLWAAVEALDNKVPASAQTAMLMDINNLIEWTALWFLRNGARPLDIALRTDTFIEGFATLHDGLTDILPGHYRDDVHERARPYMEQGVTKELAERISGLVNLYSGCDIVRLAQVRKCDVLDAAKLYFAVGSRFRLGRLRAAGDRLENQTHWQKLAAAALIEEIYEHQLALTYQVLDFVGPKADFKSDPKETIESWAQSNQVAVERTERLLSEIWAMEVNDLSVISVVSRQLRSMAEVPQSASS